MKNTHRLSIMFAFTSCIITALQLPCNPETLIKQMPLRKKIAQCIMVAAVSNEQYNKDFMAATPYRMDIKHVEELIRTEEIGGILFLSAGLMQEQAALTAHFQRLCPNIPLLISMDAEWGLSMRLRDGMRFARNMTLGAVQDNTLIYQTAYEIGKQLAEIGVHMNLAPVIDVNNNPRNPVINERSFGSDPKNVAQKGIAYSKGLHDAGIIDCVKHFPGHGDTDIDSHIALPIINHDRAHLQTTELVPFKAAIEHGTKAVMVAHMHVPAFDCTTNMPASLSKKINTDLLRNELGFAGLIVTDGLGMRGIADHHNPGAMEVQALQAGADILLAPIDVIQAINAIEKSVHAGILSEEEINQKVLHILQAKQWAFVQPQRAPSATADLIKLKKQIFAKAVTIAKDTLDAQRDKATDIILTFTNVHSFKTKNYGIPQEKLDEIKRAKELGKKVTVVIYGSPYAVETLKDADRIIVAYEDDAAAQEAVQQILAGFMQAEGVLPV